MFRGAGLGSAQPSGGRGAVLQAGDAADRPPLAAALPPEAPPAKPSSLGLPTIPLTAASNQAALSLAAGVAGGGSTGADPEAGAQGRQEFKLRNSTQCQQLPLWITPRPAGKGKGAGAANFQAR